MFPAARIAYQRNRSTALAVSQEAFAAHANPQLFVPGQRQRVRQRVTLRRAVRRAQVKSNRDDHCAAAPHEGQIAERGYALLDRLAGAVLNARPNEVDRLQKRAFAAPVRAD